MIRGSTRRLRDVRDALEILADWLRSIYRGAKVLGVGHRIAHGGTVYHRPTVITPEVMADLHRLSPLAPLHQPYNLAAVEAVFKRLPDVPQVACFDTGFHRTLSPLARLVPLPREIREGGVQRYGFHGLSYEYIATMLPQAAPEIASGRVIVAHLGSGASLCALRNGKSVDTTFGFTALDGLCMGTRPGSLDPGVVLHLCHTLRLSSKEVETILTRSPGCSVSRVSAMICAFFSIAWNRMPVSRWIISSTAPPRKSVRSPGFWAASTDWYSRPVSERTLPKFAGESASLPPGWVSDWIWSQRPQRSANLHPRQHGLGMGDSDK